MANSHVIGFIGVICLVCVYWQMGKDSEEPAVVNTEDDRYYRGRPIKSSIPTGPEVINDPGALDEPAAPAPRPDDHTGPALHRQAKHRPDSERPVVKEWEHAKPKGPGPPSIEPSEELIEEANRRNAKQNPTPNALPGQQGSMPGLRHIPNKDSHGTREL